MRDPGPFDEVAVWHMPQIQFEIFCLGARCKSAIFMSVSATKGANVYRIQRDNDLLKVMLDILICVHKEHLSIMQAKTFEELLWGRKGTKYQDFLAKIRSSGKRL